MKKKVMIPLLSLKENGGNLLIFDLAKSLCDINIKIVIISTNFHPCARIDELKRISTLILTPNICGSRALSLLYFYLYCNLWSIMHKPHVLYNFFPTQLISAHPHSRKICIVQDIEYRFFKRLSKISKLLCLNIWKQCHVITTSSYLEAFLRRLKIVPLFSADIGISNNVLSLADSSSSAISDRHFDFLLIAKKGFHKRGLETISLAQDLAKVGYKVLLIDQTDFHSTTSSIPSLSVLPAQPHASLINLLQDSKVFISLSRAEGYGLPPLEALALGCYVIATNSPSIYRLTHPYLTRLSRNSLDLAAIFNACLSQIHTISHISAPSKELLRRLPSRSLFTYYASRTIENILAA